MSFSSRSTVFRVNRQVLGTLLVLIASSASLLSLGVFNSGCSSPRPGASRNLANASPKAEHQANTQEKNGPILEWLADARQSTEKKLARRGKKNGPDDLEDYQLVEKPQRAVPISKSEAKTAAETKALYDSYFSPKDPSSYLGTFFESGHPYVETARGGYQWNSLKVSGMENLEAFDLVVNELVSKGIKSIRIAPNLHEIDMNNPKTWGPLIRKLEIIWKHGATATVSVAFFPSLKRWEKTLRSGEVDYLKSYLLNEQWAEDMGKMTEAFMREMNQSADHFQRSHPDQPRPRIVINPINEPETLAGFNRQFWHGAHAPWGDPETLRYYIPSILQIGMANVQIRLAAEKNSAGQDLLFMHNEAMTPAYYPSHKGGGRFAVSKFMLGDPIVTAANFDDWEKEPLELMRKRLDELAAANKLTEVDWCFREFVFGSWNTDSSSRSSARKELVGHFKKLQNLHAQLRAETGKTVKTNTMLNLDYYYQTEFLPNKPVKKLIHDLSADHGEKLKSVLGVEDDRAFVEMLRRAATSNEMDLPPAGPKLTFEHHDRSEIDFEDLLTREDGILFERLIGMRKDYSLSDEPEFVERQEKAGLLDLPEPMTRTDALLESLTAQKGAKLREVLGAPDASSLRTLLTAAASDTRDGGPAILIKPEDTLRDILNRKERTILNRLLGMSKNYQIGFEPQHYARQVRAGVRDGFYSYFMKYIRELKMHVVGVGESGTPFYYFAPLLHRQVMMEYATALESGLYGTQYAFGPAVHTRGWGKGPLMFHYRDDHELNPSGIIRLEKVKGADRPHFKVVLEGGNGPWLPEVTDSFFKSIKRGIPRANPCEANLLPLQARNLQN